jgi:hypothetical protein
VQLWEVNEITPPYVIDIDVTKRGKHHIHGVDFESGPERRRMAATVLLTLIAHAISTKPTFELDGIVNVRKLKVSVFPERTELVSYTGRRCNRRDKVHQ